MSINEPVYKIPSPPNCDKEPGNLDENRNPNDSFQIFNSVCVLQYILLFYTAFTNATLRKLIT